MFIEDLRMNLQLFADQDQGGANDDDAGAYDKGTGVEDDNSQHDQKNDTQDNNNTQDKTEDVFTKEELERIIQSETDKVRTKYSKEIKALKEEIESFKTAQMTEKEKQEYEEKKRQEALEAKEKELKQKELNLKSYEVITEQKLDARLRPFILAEDEEKIEENAKELKLIISSIINDALQEKIKGLGREPHKSDDTTVNDPFRAKLAKWS